MKKLSTTLVSLFVVFLICLGSIVVFTSFSSQEVHAQNSRAEKSPEDYEDNNVYYLISNTATTTVKFLRGVSIVSDATNPDINNDDLENGRPEYFTYPGQGQRKAGLEYNQSFNGNPYIQLILNSYEDVR